jgi:hypothetical protein
VQMMQYSQDRHSIGRIGCLCHALTRSVPCPSPNTHLVFAYPYHTGTAQCLHWSNLINVCFYAGSSCAGTFWGVSSTRVVYVSPSQQTTTSTSFSTMLSIRRPQHVSASGVQPASVRPLSVSGNRGANPSHVPSQSRPNRKTAVCSSNHQGQQVRNWSNWGSP